MKPFEQLLRDRHKQLIADYPAPWRWCGRSGKNGHQIFLATITRGRRYILGSKRAGMQGAVPTFPDRRGEEEWVTIRGAHEGLVVHEAPYRDDVLDIDNPVAEWLKMAPEYVGHLIAEVDRLRSKMADVASLRAVISDPGSVLPRASHTETTSTWAARAVAQMLGDSDE